MLFSEHTDTALVPVPVRYTYSVQIVPFEASSHFDSSYAKKGWGSIRLWLRNRNIE
jgi:hypothetical protein